MSNQNILVKINGDASSFERATNKAMGLSKQFAGAVGVAFSATAAVQFSRALIDISDRYTQLDGRLKLVAKSTAEFQAAQSGLYKVAQDTRVSFESTVDLYTRMARSTGELGISQKELIGITESINQALIVSGASGESASAALMQLGQGMASGVLRGEELNSVMEQTPRLAQMIADGLGVGIGQLRAMGKEGKITSEVLIGALQNGAAKVNAEFKQMPETVGQAMTKLTNAFNSIVNESNNAAGGTRGIADAIDDVAKAMDDNKDGIIAGVVAIADAAKLAVEQFAKLGAYIQENHGKAGMIGGGVAGAIAGGKIGGGAGAAIGGGVGATTGGIYAVASDYAKTHPSFLGMRSKVFSGSYGGATGSWGDPVVSAESVQLDTTTPTPRNPTPSSKTADDSASKMQERIDKLRESLMTETELENKRYEEGLKLVSDYYGKTSELTTADDELKQQLAEDHAAKMSEISGVVKWEEDLKALQDKFKSEGELEDERYASQLEKLIEFKDAELVTKEEYMQMAEDAEAMHQKNLTDINARAATDRSNKERAVQQIIQSMRYQTAQMGIELLSMFADKSKAAAIAAIALSKGLMIAQTVQSTAAASMRALAELGPIKGAPAAAAIQAMGAVQVGIIAATGLMQAASASSGGGSISTSSYGTSTTTSSDGTATTDTTTSNKTITIYGLNKDSLYSGEQVAELLNEYLADGGKLQIM